MNEALLFLNMFYFFHILTMGLYMFRKRYAAIINKEIKLNYFKSNQGEIPESLKVFENHYNNQFQAPLLFMIVCLFAIALKAATLPFVILAFLFVTSRLIHTYIHLTSNYIRMRALVFFAGFAIIGSMWLLLYIQIAFN